MNPQQDGPAGNLFFALLPDAKALDAIAQLAQQLRDKHALKAKPISSERLHVTLHYLGAFTELADELMGQARQAAEAVTTAPFDVSFDCVHSFPIRSFAKPLVLGMSRKNEDLTAFYLQLLQTLKAAGLGKGLKSSFTPHVTLLYDKAVIADQPVPAITWTAKEFALVYSVPRKGHDRLATWSLR